MSKLTSKGAVLALVAVAALLSWHTAAEPGTESGGMIYLRGRTHLYAIGSVDNEP